MTGGSTGGRHLLGLALVMPNDDDFGAPRAFGLGLALALGAAIDLAGYMHFIRGVVSRLVYDGRGSLC